MLPTPDQRPTRVLRFTALLQEEGWLTPAYVCLDAQGRLLSLSSQAPPSDLPTEKIEGFALPGFPNAHSHAFQYAMAGLAEHLPAGAASDDFWSWRETMYRLALSIDPDQLEAIATMLYAEMLRVGYTAVAEFHYLHHDPQGQPYDDLAQMGACLVAAAQRVGLSITLIPICYRTGGFQTPANPRQRRFLSQDLDAYDALLTASQRVVDASPFASLGLGAHSLRAVPPEEVIALFSQADASLPRHLHIAEQQKEVDDCLAFHGTRPVAWLLDKVPLDERFHLVHATHMDEMETTQLAATGANVVLCPSTEGNLGDGFFPLHRYLQAQGRWSIGTDSHIGLSPHEELRILDYGQRLLRQKRNILCLEDGQDSGHIVLNHAILHGQRAMGIAQPAFFRHGAPFDAAVYDATHPLLQSAPPSRRVPTILYATDTSALLGTITQGQWRTKEGKHLQHDAINQQFQRTIQSLRTQ